MSKKFVFQIGQKIVYPSQGVGKVLEITDKKFKDKTLTYYVFYLEVSDMTVMVPVDKVEELGIRGIVSKEDAQKALDSMGEDIEQVPSDWKLRYQQNLDLQKKGSIFDIATIVRSLYKRSKVKELPILERKLYDSAKKLLEDELAAALELSAKEIEELIHTKLEPLGMSDSKSIITRYSDDEDDEFSSDDMDEDMSEDGEEDEEDEEEEDDDEE